MKAIIMAGGFGTRLRPLTINTPKPMVPVVNRPIIGHVVSLLCKHKIFDITAVLYFQADQIRNYFGDGSSFGVDMKYSNPTEDFGTAGAVRFALPDLNEPVLIISGDLITDFDLSEAIKWHEDKKSEATILLTHHENPLAYGIVITDEEGRIVRFLEKPSWGEAFSDTINTGIYILEPDVIKMIPRSTNYDFSQNLFPKMLNDKRKLFGRVTNGYWRDVGNVDEYRQVHFDFFEGQLQLELESKAKKTGSGVVYFGKGAKVDKDAVISGKVFLGDGAVVMEGCQLENSVIGNSTVVEPSCKLKKSIVWSEAVIGRETLLNEAIVGNRSRTGRNVALVEDSIVSDDCHIGEFATVKANCKIWPGKTVDDGAVVSSSLVWGEKWNRELFTDAKITGLALTEITPEMVVKIGSAFGASLGHGQSVVTSRDASDLSRLLKRGLLSGLLAAGINVSDLEMMPLPVVRYKLQKGGFSAGIYLRHNPLDYRLIDLIFLDGAGIDMASSKLKKVERLYIGEDYARVMLDQIGRLSTPQYVLEDYQREFISHIKIDLIREAGFKVVIDHSNGVSSQIFPTIFSELGITAIELNASLAQRRSVSGVSDIKGVRELSSASQVSSIVRSLKADIGFIVNPATEKLVLLDEKGDPIDDQLLLLIVIDLFLKLNKVKTIAVPVNASMGVDKIAQKNSVEVIRIPSSHLAMMEISRSGKVGFVGGTKGGFIFPGFQHCSDAIISTVKILEMLAQTKVHLSEYRHNFEIFRLQTVSVPCPWTRKGTVLRKLISDTKDKPRELIDGVRIFENNGWVLITPDRDKASFNIVAEAASEEKVRGLIELYRKAVQEYQTV
jgi:mannose-1-phosphate guanylyltransferase/phosphomannomutase